MVESASTFFATSRMLNVISSIEVADSCTAPARFDMFSATSSFAADISKIDDEDSSADAASVSRKPKHERHDPDPRRHGHRP